MFYEIFELMVNRLNTDHTSNPRKTLFLSTLFHCNINKIPEELNTCIYQLAYGKLVSLHNVFLKVAEPINNVKQGHTAYINDSASAYYVSALVLGTEYL